MVLRGHHWGVLQHVHGQSFWAGPASVRQLGAAAPPQPGHSAAQGRRRCPAAAVSVAGQVAEAPWLPAAGRAAPAWARQGPHCLRCLAAVGPWQPLMPWSPLHWQVPRCESWTHHDCLRAAPCLELCDADCGCLQAQHQAARVHCQALARFVAPLQTGWCRPPSAQSTPLHADWRPLQSRVQHQEQHLGVQPPCQWAAPALANCLGA